MSNRNNTGLGLIIGLAAGAAAGFWLNSNQGRKWRKDSMEKANEYGTVVKEAAQSGVEAVSSTMSSTVGKGKDYLVVLADMVKERLEKTEEGIESAEVALSRGAKKAQQTIKETSAKVKSSIDNA